LGQLATGGTVFAVRGTAAALRLADADAQHPHELAGLRAKLEANRDTTPLFDTPRYVRNLEQAYRALAAQWKRTAPPRRILA
jgi:predicted O-linked N-acetylglucosamine transferase (SPINDLY family)